MDMAGPTRRTVLAGGLLVLASCSAGSSPEPDEAPDPDTRIRADAAGGVRRLVELYATVAVAHPGLRAELSPLAAETTAHLSALQPDAAPTTSTSTGGSSPSATATSTTTSTPTEARRTVARAERREAEARVGQLALASPALARLLAAIGASEATHATLLGAGR